MILRIHSDCMDDDVDRQNQYLYVEMMKSVVVVRCSQFILILNTIYINVFKILFLSTIILRLIDIIRVLDDVLLYAYISSCEKKLELYQMQKTMMMMMNTLNVYLHSKYCFNVSTRISFNSFFIDQFR